MIYTYTSKRPYKKNNWMPNNGWGFRSMIDISNEDLYGDFTYQRTTVDTYSNCKLGMGTLYVRGKGIYLNGNPPAQEYVGLSDDEPIYLFGKTDGFTENINLRGSSGFRLGNCMAMSTVEYRISLMETLPVNIFGISLGNVSGALISDIGNAWYTEQDMEDWIITAGAELKLGLRIGDMPLFYYSIGYAQTLDNWMDENEPELYIQCSLINPF